MPSAGEPTPGLPEHNAVALAGCDPGYALRIQAALAPWLLPGQPLSDGPHLGISVPELPPAASPGVCPAAHRDSIRAGAEEDSGKSSRSRYHRLQHVGRT